MSMAEQHQPQAPERRGSLSFIGWAQVTGTLIALLVVGAVLRLIGPYVGWWAPIITDVFSGMLIACIIAAPIALGLHFWQKNRRENFRSRLVRPTQENAYPAYWDGQTFQQPVSLPPPMKVPTNLNFPPTVQQRNDTELIRMLRDIVYRQMAYAQQQEEELAELDIPALPSYVEYEHIRHLIPRGHALVGVTSSGIETKDDSIRALLWIVGGSGSGKTNSTVIHVDDDARRGHQFLGVDPHFIKPDSLTNALGGYTHLFRRPIAHTPEDIEAVLDEFLTEFTGRKDEGWPLEPPITLVVDEVGDLMMDIDKSDQVAVRIADKLKRIARICGHESRDFHMVGIYITQGAIGLAWLRRYAVMVLAHQVLMMNERLLVCNQNKAIAESMDNWPRGRTLVYGIAFENGPLLVQQPLVKTRVIDAASGMPDLPQKQPERAQELTGTWNNCQVKQPECTQELTGTENDENFFLPLALKKFLHEAARKYAHGESINSILKEGGLAPSGRNNQNLKMLLDGMATEE